MLLIAMFPSLDTILCYSSAGGHPKLGLIRSPTTLQQRRYIEKKHEYRQSYFHTIVTEYHGPLDAVDCYIHTARYDMVL